MNGNEFIRRVRKIGKRRDIAVRFEPQRGKGSHSTLFLGERNTVVKDRRK